MAVDPGVQIQHLQLRRDHCTGSLEADIGDDNTPAASCEREEHALGEQMPDESPARGAERQTHRQLPAAASSIGRGRDW